MSFGIQKTDDKEFTSRRRTEESCTWGRGDGATFSNHSSSTAIVPSFVILCWLYFQMTRISISLRKGMVDFCNVSLLCFQTIYIHVLLPYKLVTVTLMVGRLGYICSGFHIPLNFLLPIQCSGAEWNFICVSQYVVLSTIIATLLNTAWLKRGLFLAKTFKQLWKSLSVFFFSFLFILFTMAHKVIFTLFNIGTEAVGSTELMVV